MVKSKTKKLYKMQNQLNKFRIFNDNMQAKVGAYKKNDQK